MSIADRTGARAHPVGGVDFNEMNVDRMRDMTMVAMRREGWTQREIGVHLNVNQTTVGRHLAAIPPDVRKYLEEQARATFGDQFDKAKVIESVRLLDDEEADVIVRESDHSQAVERLGVADDSPEVVERLVSLLALALVGLGLDPLRVGYVVGLSKSEVERRVEEIPHEVKAFARSASAQLLQSRP